MPVFPLRQRELVLLSPWVVSLHSAMSTVTSNYRHGDEAGEDKSLLRRRACRPGWCRAGHAEATIHRRSAHDPQ